MAFPELPNVLPCYVRQCPCSRILTYSVLTGQHASIVPSDSAVNLQEGEGATCRWVGARPVVGVSPPPSRTGGMGHRAAPQGPGAAVQWAPPSVPGVPGVPGPGRGLSTRPLCSAPRWPSGFQQQHVQELLGGWARAWPAAQVPARPKETLKVRLTPHRTSQLRALSEAAPTGLQGMSEASVLCLTSLDGWGRVDRPPGRRHRGSRCVHYPGRSWCRHQPARGRDRMGSNTEHVGCPAGPEEEGLSALCRGPFPTRLVPGARGSHHGPHPP